MYVRPFENHEGKSRLGSKITLVLNLTTRLRFWPLVPMFAGSNPVETVGFFRAIKIPSTLSFGGEVKPAVPYRRFAAQKVVEC
jgi:hypothetical protein